PRPRRARGPALALPTAGRSPLRIARPGHSVLHWRTPRVTVVDTVGAGDSLAACLLARLTHAGVTERAAPPGPRRRPRRSRRLACRLPPRRSDRRRRHRPGRPRGPARRGPLAPRGRR